MDKEEVKKFLKSEIFEEKPGIGSESLFILNQIKGNVMVNIDKPGIDVVDLFHWAVNHTFQVCLKGVLDDLRGEDEGQGFGQIEVDKGLLS